jgi:hypothetical protein
MSTPKINIIETQKTTPQKNVVEVKLPTEVETATIATPRIYKLHQYNKTHQY